MRKLSLSNLSKSYEFSRSGNQTQAGYLSSLGYFYEWNSLTKISNLKHGNG